MIAIDISKDYLELFTAKKDIEDVLIKKEEISEPFSISDFIKYINFGTHVYWLSSDKIFPFKLINTPKEQYLFIITNNNNTSIKPLTDALSDIDYDFTKLTRKNVIDIATEDIVEKPHFIINNELYYKETTK